MPKGNPLGYLLKNIGKKEPKKDDKKPKMKDLFKRTAIHGVRG